MSISPTVSLFERLFSCVLCVSRENGRTELSFLICFYPEKLFCKLSEGAKIFFPNFFRFCDFESKLFIENYLPICILYLYPCPCDVHDQSKREGVDHDTRTRVGTRRSTLPRSSARSFSFRVLSSQKVVK